MLDQNALDLRETILDDSDPLKLELENEEFIDVIDKSIAASRAYYSNKRLYERQDKMLDYYLGNQIDPKKIDKKWQTPFVENIVYEGVRRIKPIAVSRLPDLTVRSSTNPQAAQLTTDLLNTDIRKRSTRKLLGLAHVHEQLMFYAVIKGRWNSEKGDDGDYEFVNVYPRNIVWDHTCKTNDADDMRFIAESTELTVKEVCMMFPDSRDKFIAALGWQEGDERSEEERMASKVTITEVWFHWWKEQTDEMQNKKWEKINAVVWKYQSCVLGKMRNPYFDYAGKVRLFDPRMTEKDGMSDQEFYASWASKQSEVQSQTIYYNYFKNPRKPYFFMVYESLGNDPIDATNRIEQILYFQDHINNQGRQIIEMNERSAGKPVINADALDKDVIEKLDWRNFKQALTVGGDDINKTFTYVAMPAAPPQLYKSKDENRSIGFEMMGVNATTRGVREGDQTLGEAQMFREQDFGFIDDLVEDTINAASEWIAQWSMQFIRIFYTKQHFKEVVGTDGESLWQAIDQDIIDDGMVVAVSASAVDKMMRKRLAMETFKLGASDLLSFYEDLGVDNPKEKARRAFLMQSSPQMYYQTYLADNQMEQPMVRPVDQAVQQAAPQDTQQSQVPPQQ